MGNASEINVKRTYCWEKKHIELQLASFKLVTYKTFYMEPAKTFRDLIMWQKSHQYVLSVYKYTKEFPKEEKFALGNQFRRAAVSIAANIAEGFKKKSNKDKIRIMNISQGSLEECRYYEILSKDLEYGETSHLTNILEEVSRLLNAYIKKLGK